MELAWQEIKSEVKAVNPELFKIIEEINPKSNETFVKVGYPYGASITDNGDFYLPNQKGHLVPIQDADIDPKIKRLFDYTFIPLGLLLNKASEIFVKLDGRVVSLNVLRPGDLFGLFEATDLLSGVFIKPVWCVSAGSRSIFMLPKISDMIGHKKLKKKYEMISATPPATFEDHGKTFKTIVSQSKAACQWQHQVLYFTRSWFDLSKPTDRFSKLYNYLFKKSHLQGIHSLNETAIHLTWQKIILWLGRRNLKPRPYLVDTLQRLIHIASSTLPGFAVADHSEIFAPTKLIQEEYIETYGLKKYLPTILYAEKMLGAPEIDTIYYSLAHPFLYEGVPSHKSPIPIIDDLRSMKFMIDTLQDALKSKKFSIPNISGNLYRAQFNYFHTGKDVYNEIKTAEEFIKLDPRFENDKKLYQKRETCTTSPFFNGFICIKVNSA